MAETLGVSDASARFDNGIACPSVLRSFIATARVAGGGVMRFLLLTVVFASAAITASAQQYPARPVRVYIPFTAGSAADIIMRALEPQMREKLGQSFIIDNRGGAGGNIAAELTAKSPADGYSVMMATVGTHAINLALYSKLPFHPQRDFTSVALVGENPNILVINPVVPAKSIQEFIALRKAGPGRSAAGGSHRVKHRGDRGAANRGSERPLVCFRRRSEANAGGRIRTADRQRNQKMGGGCEIVRGKSRLTSWIADQGLGIKYM